MLEATTRTANIFYDGKMLITELYDEVVIELEDALENYHIVMDIVNDRKYVSLVIMQPYTTVTREAREDNDRAERYAQCIAQAIVVSSLANRILGNFMIRFLKLHCPQRLFRSRNEAIAWLNHHWELHQHTVEAG